MLFTEEKKMRNRLKFVLVSPNVKWVVIMKQSAESKVVGLYEFIIWQTRTSLPSGDGKFGILSNHKLHCESKKQDMPITSDKIDRFSRLFH